MTHEQMMDQNAYDNLRKENAMLRAQLAQAQAARTICDVHQAEFDRLEEQVTDLTAKLVQAQAEIEDWRSKLQRALTP